ncbi:MAG TPA: alpha/beta fold hydrolase [Terracidiphilus sp.]|nr:alpha/beta fold hydrolase [Terracidiphilus sp.]
MKIFRISALALVALVVTLLSPSAFTQTTLAGDWHGTLDAGGTQLHLILHIAAASNGTLSATLDSVDQGALGIPVSTIALKGSSLNLTVDAVHGTYEGTVNAANSEITGTWSQGMALPLNFHRGVAPPEPKPAPPSDIDGNWLGSLNLGPVELRIVLKITNTADGLTAKLQSPDQSPNWIPISSITRAGDALSFDIPAIGASFQGKLAPGLGSVSGTFSQNGKSFPLTLNKVAGDVQLERPRPQNPVKPYPYREEEVTYPDKAAGATLAGTLTLPPGKGPFPAVLLIAGSGPHDRDENLMGHKPFLVLSDYLTRHGIVVLRYDKRGIAKSTGNYDTATTADFADDAEAGVQYLKTVPQVDPRRIGLIGHSEGGTIAPIVAVKDPSVAFVILMAGTGVPGDQVILEQERLIDEANGETKEKAEQDAARQRQILDLVKSEKDSATLEVKLRAQLTPRVPAAQVGAQIKALTTPWFRYFLTYDPATTLRKLTCPVLVLNGSLDLQVPPAQNLPPIRKALEEAGNKHFEIDELHGLNHLFQTAKTGSPLEYGRIEQTMSPVALDKIATWILKQ